MEPLTQRSVQNLWLGLLVVFVFCASVVSPAYLAEVQPQQVELESEFVPDASEDDEPIIGFISEVFAKELPSVPPSSGEALSIVGSDAYPAITLHGPPVPNNTV
jgi:hypothetical protein